MEKIINDHKAFWLRGEFLFSVLAGFLFFIASLLINYAAGSYATRSASNAVTDIILDNIPVIDTGIVFVEGSLLFVLLVAGIFIKEPWRMPFILKTAAFFILIRSFFIILTHIGPMPDQIPIDTDSLIRMITFGGDLFFSGHTGLPFLFALAFWDNKILRTVFLAASIIAGVSVLLGHLHYSIDVFAAFFITYSIFAAAKKLFAFDYDIFLRGLPAGNGN